MRNFGEKGAWAYPGTAHFFKYPLLSQELEKQWISNLASTFRGSIRTKAHEKFWRKGSVGVSRDCQNFLGTPYYPRNGKSYGVQIWPVHPEGSSEQKPTENFGEKGAWAYPGTAQFFRVPILSQERVKLRTSNFACTFIGSIGTKAH